MAEKVEIIIEAEDNASRVIAGVGDELNTLASTAMKENLMDLKEVGSAAFSAIGDSVGQLMKIAADDELVMMRMNAQLKALGETANVSEDDIVALAEQLSKLSGFDDEALIEGQTTLLRFGTLSKEQFEQATKAAADLAAMTGMDLVSAFRQVGIALDNPEQGFGRLKRQIGDLTEEQQAAIDKMIEMGDVAGAQGIILDALAQKTNGAAEAFGETFTGKVGIARTAVENFESSVGELIIQPLPQWLITTGVAAGEAGNMLGPVVSSLADLAIVLMAIQKSGGLSGLTASLSKLPLVLGIVKGGLIGLAFAITVGMLNEFGKFTANLGKMLGDALGIKLPAELDKLRNILIEHGPFSKEAWTQVIVAIESGWNTIKTKLSAKIAEWRQIGTAWINGLKEGIKSAWSSLTSELSAWINSLIARIKAQLGIASPSKLFAEAIGKPIAQGIQLGFTKQMAKGVQVDFGKQMTLATAPITETLAPTDYRMGGGRSGGGGAINVNLVYSPAVSIASRAEAENVLGPYINDVLRQLRK